MPKKTPKSPAKKAVAKKSPAKKPYSLEIRVNDVDFKVEANSMEEALLEFVNSPEFPVGAKTNAFLKYSKGKNVRTRVWHTPEARRALRTMKFKGSLLGVLAAKLTEDLA